MKATAEPQRPAFTPIAITITLESKHEADAVYTMFNHERIRHACGLLLEDTAAVRKAFASAGYVAGEGTYEIHKKLVSITQ